MRRVAAFVAVSIGLGSLAVASVACKKAKKAVPAASANEGPETADPAPAPPANGEAPPVSAGEPATEPRRPAAPPPKPKLQIQLRSTPSGADTVVDGQPRGRTPVTVDVDDDGREHEFTFVLEGYELARYRTAPVRSGVIHPKLRKVEADAGPQ